MHGAILALDFIWPSCWGRWFNGIHVTVAELRTSHRSSMACTSHKVSYTSTYVTPQQRLFLQQITVIQLAFSWNVLSLWNQEVHRPIHKSTSMGFNLSLFNMVRIYHDSFTNHYNIIRTSTSRPQVISSLEFFQQLQHHHHKHNRAVKWIAS